MHFIYLMHEFHNLSWITEINELFHDILINWDAPVHDFLISYIPCALLLFSTFRAGAILSNKSQPRHTQPCYLFDHNEVVRLWWGCVFNSLVLKLPGNLNKLFYLIKSLITHAYVVIRGGKSTKILYSSKSTITLLKFYLSTSKSTSLKIYSSKSKK